MPSRKRKLQNAQNPTSKRRKLNSSDDLHSELPEYINVFENWERNIFSFDYYYNILYNLTKYNKLNEIVPSIIVELISKYSEGYIIRCKRGDKCKSHIEHKETISHVYKKQFFQFLQFLNFRLSQFIFKRFRFMNFIL